MTKYIVRRTVESLPVLIGVSVLVFLLLHLIPGDPAVVILGERATPERIEEVRDQLGLNRPLYEQYFIWMGNAVQGDLGTTINGKIPVSKELRTRFPATIELSVSALFFATLLGVPIGIVSAIRRNSLVDTLSMFGALFGVSIPIFVLGLLLIFFVGVKWDLLPFIGRLDPDIELDTITGFYVIDSILTGNWEALKNSIEHLILPAFALSTIPLSIIARITRSAMLEVLNQDYIRTAQAKGLRQYKVIMIHAFRNAMLPVITIIGLQLGALLSGAVLTETIFSWPGIGKWLFEAIARRDYPIIQATTLLIATVYVGVNLGVDLLYAFIDPRIRYSGAE